jgi:hypothetical protein
MHRSRLSVPAPSECGRWARSLDQCRTSVAQEASDTSPTSGAPCSFDGCVGSDLTGGWDILLYEKV